MMTTAARERGVGRDEAFAGLIALETRRRTLEAAVRNGDAEASEELSALRPCLARQAVLAADLDVAADMAEAAAADGSRHPDAAERRLAALAARRLELARAIEGHVQAIVAACHAIAENTDAFAAAGLAPTPIEAELGRFGDRLCFYLDSMLDFVTGARGLAGHPAYRKLAEVLLDGEAILKLYRRAAGACGGDPSGA